jgi:hypothetical protein
MKMFSDSKSTSENKTKNKTMMIFINECLRNNEIKGNAAGQEPVNAQGRNDHVYNILYVGLLLRKTCIGV